MKIGDKFGKWTVLRETNRKSGEHKYWLCLCQCGNIVEVISCNLLNGRSKGCEKCRVLNSIRNKNKRLDIIYNGIIQRCNNPKATLYNSYGGRGIKICDEWLGEKGKINFYNWAIKNGYQKNLTIDRINVNGNYEPNNCRWATKTEQANNTRNNRKITYNGETKTLAEWARYLGMSQQKLKYRLDNWDIKKAFEK